MKPENSTTYDFLNDGGEMGELTRSYDWSTSSLGSPDQWPQSLRTTLGIILHSAFPMLLFWGKDLICFYNDAFRPSLGIDGKHPAIAKKGEEVWNDIWQYIGPLIDGVIKTGKSVYFEDQLVGFYRNGSKEDIYWTFSYSPAYGDDGKINGVFVTCTETTEKVKLIKSLGEGAEEVQALVESAPFPIGVYRGKEMRVAFANQSIMDIWGKGNKVVGKLFSEVLPELDNQEVFKQLDEVYNTGIAFHIKNQPLDLIVEGKPYRYYFNYSLTPLFNKEGKVYGVMNTGVDLTELNLAKRKIEESEKNLRNTILQAPVAMCIFKGPQFIVEIANERMFELWGRPGADVLNKPIFEGLPEAKEQGFEAMLEGVYSTGKTFHAEGIPTNLPRNGKIETVYINFVYEAYHEADGTISGILAVAVDVTPQEMARRKIEEVVAGRTKELAEANSNLQKSNAELAQFAYIASHDLQEPLRKIGTFSQMLEKSLGSQMNDQSRNYFNKINTSASRMNALVRDVLAYSEVTKENELFVQVDLNKVFESTKADYDLLIEQKEAILTSDALPVIDAIPLQMSQLFGNLLGNALKFVRKEVKPHISITVSTLTEEEKNSFSFALSQTYYNIRFADNGVGIQPDYTEKIFHIFQRLHRKSEFEGTGIGLAMCKKIALNHHGDINAEGSSENGAVFNVILPAKQEETLNISLLAGK